MLLNPVIAMLHDETNDRWHPIVFQEAPLPGSYDPDRPRRWKSKMHHGAGFATRAEAEADANDSLAPRLKELAGGVTLKLEEVFGWDGEGVPASVAFFDLAPESARPAE